MGHQTHILLIIPSLGFGGAETAMCHLAAYLGERFNVTLCYLSGEPLTGRGGKVKYLKLGHLNPRQNSILPPMFRQLISVSKIINWTYYLYKIRKLKKSADLSISFLPGGNLLNVLSGRTEETICSLRGSRIDDTDLSKTEKFFWTNLIDPIVYRLTNRIICASRYIENETKILHPRIKQKIYFIEGLISLQDLDSALGKGIEPEFMTYRNFPTIVAYGRLHYAKGYDFLIRAFARVRVDNPSARLILIGDGPELANLLSLAQSRGLRCGFSADPLSFDVTFSGYKEYPVRYLKVAKVFAFTSRYEGLPNALLEALASDCNVLCSKFSGAPFSHHVDIRSFTSREIDKVGDLCQSLNIKLLSSPDSNDSEQIWAEAIEEALSRENLSVQPELRRRYLTSFDLKSSGEKWIEHIRETLRRKK
jgi:glycosyltransferase involved in cell wall biosynthesis